MKNRIISALDKFLVMPAVSAGIIFCACAFAPALPKNVEINGVSVGGKSRAQAVSLVREKIISDLKSKALTVCGANKNYVFTYPEISFKDNLQSLTRSVKKGQSYTAEVSYYLNGLSEITQYVCAAESAPVTEPYAVFNKTGAPFCYRAGADGYIADGVKLQKDILSSLSGGFEKVFVKRDVLKRKSTLADVKERTRLISAFTTYFDGTNSDRVHNIRLAAEKINGLTLAPRGCFSFNGAVGERTAERGFKSAKIIEKGEFTEGIGGGVCQVSTTLFNAALLAGCEICEYHPHSLAVGYVPPSCDAMVSGTYYDLKFKNTLQSDLYIRAAVGENYVTFCFYGKSDGAYYSYSSQVTGSIPAPEEATEDISLVKDGRDGILSEGYLTVTRGGLKKTVLFRRDKYAPVKRVVLREPLSVEITDGGL